MFGCFGLCLDVLAYVWILWLMFDVSLDVLAYVWILCLMVGLICVKRPLLSTDGDARIPGGLARLCVLPGVDTIPYS